MFAKLRFVSKHSQHVDAKAESIIYKIVDQLDEERYVLQCINIGRVFTLKI